MFERLWQRMHRAVRLGADLGALSLALWLVEGAAHGGLGAVQNIAQGAAHAAMRSRRSTCDRIRSKEWPSKLLGGGMAGSLTPSEGDDCRFLCQ